MNRLCFEHGCDISHISPSHLYLYSCKSTKVWCSVSPVVVPVFPYNGIKLAAALITEDKSYVVEGIFGINKDSPREIHWSVVVVLTCENYTARL